MMHKYTLLLILFVTGTLRAQPGSINGKIVDQQTGEELTGANVLLIGTTLGAIADMDGTFHIARIPAGIYAIRISFVGYTTKVITDITVEEGATITLNAVLVPDVVTGEEITVTAERVLSSEASVIAQRKKAATIGDGISHEQIKRSPDATSGDALKRVTGISVVDNKFVYVRGITDRYNNTTLDGASVTSTESGKKGFSFDLLPSNLLENAVVVKSAVPDLPGDFTGGLVQLNTLDFPSQRTMRFTVATSRNSLTTGKEILSSQGGRTDWLAVDDGSRARVEGTTTIQEIAKELPNNWAPRRSSAPLNGSFSLSVGDLYTLGDGLDHLSHQLGYVAALSYSNKFQRNEITIDEKTSGGDLLRQIDGAQDNYSVLWGGVANISYKVSGLHKFSFKNNYNRSGEDRVSRTSGADANIGSEIVYTSTHWGERASYTAQLSGDHLFPDLGAVRLQWRGAVSTSRRTDPDRKLLPYTRPLGSAPEDPFTVTTSDRSWERLNDRSRNFGFDLSLPLSDAKVKAGTFVESRKTDYIISAYRIDGLGADFSLFSLPIETVYAPENFGTRGFRFMENPSNAASNYEADAAMFATYAMGELPFNIGGADFRFVGGARLERSTQNMFTTIAPGDPTQEHVQLKKNDVLPSANLTTILSDNMNIRFAYSQTVNRPEFRELASVAYYDFERFETVYGNPRLNRALIRNYDVRFELFPGIGEVFAVSYFTKRISNPIEEVYQNSSTPVRTWFNSNHATNFGWELEIRKSLGFLGEYLSNLIVTANYTRIESEVQVPPQDGLAGTGSTRPLQGQSPYVVNLTVAFHEPILGTSVTVLYNKFGKRLDAVGGQNEPDIYEEPMDLVDMSITQPLWFDLEAKFSIKNLLGKDRVLTKRGEFFRRNETGSTLGLSLSMSL